MSEENGFSDQTLLFATRQVSSYPASVCDEGGELSAARALLCRDGIPQEEPVPLFGSQQSGLHGRAAGWESLPSHITGHLEFAK